jgi:hypothetical protein
MALKNINFTGRDMVLTYDPANDKFNVSSPGMEVINQTASTSTTQLDLAGRSRRYFVVTMSANTTFTFVNIAAGLYTEWTVELRQDATGGRTATWPLTLWDSIASHVPSTGANDQNIFDFWTPDGTRLRGALTTLDGVVST